MKVAAMNKILRNILFITIVLTIVSSVIALELPDWYSIEEWELEVCSKWGGSELEQQGATTASGQDIPLSQLTLTIQAEGYIYNVSGTENTYLVTWYIEPARDKIDYRVTLITEDGTEIGLSEGKAATKKPGTGNEPFTHLEKFAYARLEFPGDYVQIPVIKK